MERIHTRHVTEAAECARDARAAGRTVLVYKFGESKDYVRFSGSLPGAAAQIQAIEAEGWALADMTSDGQKCELICLFRATA